MLKVYVIFVSPKYQGNIGALARVMKNFDLENLIIVNPQVPIDEEAYRYAMHADDILKNAKIVNSLDDAIKNMNLVIGTSGISTLSEKHFLRIPKSPQEIGKFISEFEGNVAIVFGREDIGLLNDELEKMDLFLHIETSEKYPVMNITHAAAIIFYEIFKNRGISQEKKLAEREDLDRLYQTIVKIVDSTLYPNHKKKNSYRMIKRLLGRSGITKWEYHILMGILKEILNQCQKMPPPSQGKPP
ncbi:MAG: RNA methyltransferase [Thermoplasmata archaeon]|nr:RNA methyltransferase [Thermoplasmata archaeon]